MALPKSLRLKGHRSFDYLHKNSKKYYGKLMTFKIAKSNPRILLSHKNGSDLKNFKISFTISKKVSKKAVERNRLRRLLQDCFLKTYWNDNNHKPYWLLVNLKSGNPVNDENNLLKEFQDLIKKSGLFK